ncbi:MAG: phospho-N-acetylmuramoyl-pentapeptide-transferase [Spirochaetia bacterium]|nr:phospho-N-acetylmuramoyl-pentapeptide-transferase [Spirochaetia bacterium]
MFKEIFNLVDRISIFNLFQYITFRSGFAAVTAVLVTFLAAPKMIGWLRVKKAEQMIRKDGPQSHLAKAGTPTMGGLLIVMSITVAVLLWQDLKNPYTWVLLISFWGYALIGFVDDYLKIFRHNSKGLNAKLKLAGQFAVSIAVVVYLYVTVEDITLLYVPFIKNPVADMGWLYIPFAVLLLAGFSNAVNLADGLDGLASGLITFVGLTFGLLTYIVGHAAFARYLQFPFIPMSGELTVTCMALSGACLGFLWYNAHPAQIFMGDTGSLALGGMIGVLSLLIKKELLIFIVGGVFVMEAASVMLQVLSFKLFKKRIFRMAPLHHHFELKGWTETQVVVRFWILGGLFSLISLITLKVQ